jgi:hypothetical protein
MSWLVAKTLGDSGATLSRVRDARTLEPVGY